MRITLEMTDARKEKPPERETHLTSAYLLFVTSDDQVYTGFYHTNGYYYVSESPHGSVIGAADPNLLSAGMKLVKAWGFVSHIRVDATVVPGHPPDCQCSICVYTRLAAQPPIICGRCGAHVKVTDGVAIDPEGHYCIPCGRIRGIKV